MVPANRAGAVSIVKAELTGNTKHIFSEITRQVYPVIFIESIIGLHVQIIEIKAVPVDG